MGYDPTTKTLRYYDETYFRISACICHWRGVPPCADPFARTQCDRGGPARSLYEHGLRVHRYMACTAIEDDAHVVPTAVSLARWRNIMRVIQFEQFGNPSQLHIAKRPQPWADAGNIRSYCNCGVKADVCMVGVAISRLLLKDGRDIPCLCIL
jgi:hypothetical protein